MRGVQWESGIVLEARGRTVILLTRNGEFRRATVAGRIPDIGEEIAVPSRNAAFALRSIFEWPVFGAAAVAALLFIILVLAGMPGHNPPGWLKFGGARQSPHAQEIVAYVSVDINPSLELALDASTVVVEARGFNEDGERLLDSAGVVGRKATEAIEVLTEKAIEDHFIGGREPGGIILLAVTPQVAAGVAQAQAPGSPGSIDSMGSAGSKMDSRMGLDPEALGEELRRAAGLVLAERGVRVASIETLTVDKASRDEAVRRGLSAGRLALVTRAREAGIRIGIDDVRKGRIGEVMAHAGVNLHDLLAASKGASGMLQGGGGGQELAGLAGPRPPKVAIFMKAGGGGASVTETAGMNAGVKTKAAGKGASAGADMGSGIAAGGRGAVEIGRVSGLAPAKEMRLALSESKSRLVLGQDHRPAVAGHTAHPAPGTGPIIGPTDLRLGSLGLSGGGSDDDAPGMSGMASETDHGYGREGPNGSGSPSSSASGSDSPNAGGAPTMLASASASDVSISKGAGIATAPDPNSGKKAKNADSNANAGSLGSSSRGLEVSDLALSKGAGVSKVAIAIENKAQVKQDKVEDKGENKNSGADEDKDKGKDKAKDKDEDKDKVKPN